WVLRPLPAGGAEDDGVVRGDLLDDDLGRIAGSCDQSLGTFVVGKVAEELVQGRAAPAALGDMQKRDRPVVRAREIGAEPGRELRVSTTAHRHENSFGSSGGALHHGDVSRWITKDLLDRRAEDVPAGSVPAHQQ